MEDSALDYNANWMHGWYHPQSWHEKLKPMIKFIVIL